MLVASCWLLVATCYLLLAIKASGFSTFSIGGTSRSPSTWSTDHRLLITHYALLATCYLLLATHHLPRLALPRPGRLAIGCFPLATSNLLLPTCYFPLPTCYLLLATCYLLLSTKVDTHRLGGAARAQGEARPPGMSDDPRAPDGQDPPAAHRHRLEKVRALSIGC